MAKKSSKKAPVTSKKAKSAPTAAKGMKNSPKSTKSACRNVSVRDGSDVKADKTQWWTGLSITIAALVVVVLAFLLTSYITMIGSIIMFFIGILLIVVGMFLLWEKSRCYVGEHPTVKKTE